MSLISDSKSHYNNSIKTNTPKISSQIFLGQERLGVTMDMKDQFVQPPFCLLSLQCASYAKETGELNVRFPKLFCSWSARYKLGFFFLSSCLPFLLPSLLLPPSLPFLPMGVTSFLEMQRQLQSRQWIDSELQCFCTSFVGY